MKVYGFNMNDAKLLRIALTAIFGLGRYRANLVMDYLGLRRDMLVGNLTEDQVESLNNHLRGLSIEAVLRNRIRENVIHKIKIGSYKGMRHLKRLPVRGQRTSTNGRTNRYLPKRF